MLEIESTFVADLRNGDQQGKDLATSINGASKHLTTVKWLLRVCRYLSGIAWLQHDIRESLRQSKNWLDYCTAELE